MPPQRAANNSRWRLPGVDEDITTVSVDLEMLGETLEQFYAEHRAGDLYLVEPPQK